MTKPIPILITWDVDPSPEIPLEARKQSLQVAVQLCKEFRIESTFFVTANSDHASPDELENIKLFGGEIGCHGLTHGNEEDYDKMPEAIQRSYLELATRKLEKVSGCKIRVFRSPRVKISATTIQILSELGYITDSSVCSQRIDFISSNLINLGWLTAPRLPYKPHYNNVYKQGALPLLEIPISAVGVPFISASLSVLGISFMKVLFRLLYAEAQQTGKPVVYLGHPIEFTAGWQIPFSWRELTPGFIRTHGVLLRKRLYRLNPPEWLTATKELFTYMRSFPDIQFMTTGDYAAGYHIPLPE